MPFDLERLTHSFKTALACIVAVLISKWIGLPADQWVVITVIVVMCAQLYVGSMLQKAYLRFLGTVIGCLLASLTLLFAGHSTLAIVGSIALSSFIFSYAATAQERWSYAGTLGAVTTAIIMMGQNPTVLFAIERFLEISLGIFIATLISQYILPTHARTHLRRTQVTTLKQLRSFYVATVIEHTLPTELEAQRLDETIVQSILRQRQLAKEAVREKIHDPFNTPHFMTMLYYEREVLRTIIFMHHALFHMQHYAARLLGLPSLHAFNKEVLKLLDKLIEAIASDKPSTTHVHLPDLIQLKATFQAERTQVPDKEWVYVDGFLFSAEILTEDLTKLAQLYEIPIYQ